MFGGPLSAMASSDGPTFSNAQSTWQHVQQTYPQWGRTASVPYGALRGTPSNTTMLAASSQAMERSVTESHTSPSSLVSDTVESGTLSMKRGISEDDSDAILAGAFDDDDGAGAIDRNMGLSCSSFPMASPSPPPAQTQPTTYTQVSSRPVRPLPSRQGMFRSIKSMPVAKTQDLTMDNDNSEPFQRVDFSAYAAHPHGF